MTASQTQTRPHDLYRRTQLGCVIGIFVQAIVTNLTAILFLPMMRLYGLEYQHLGILVAVNFLVQVGADIFSSQVVDRLGFRRLVLPANAMAGAGLVLFALTPWLMPRAIFSGLLLATVIFSFAAGLLETLLSPIVDAIPNDDAAGAMSGMHSFYAWGQAATIVVTTLLLFLLGEKAWTWIVLGWAMIPLSNVIVFARSVFPEVPHESERRPMRELLRESFYLLALLAIATGAGAELVMNQWASTFMEKALSLPKVSGDLLGMTGFALMLGLGRAWHARFGKSIDLSLLLIGGSAVATACYLAVAFSPWRWLTVVACVGCGIAVALLWPGTLVLSSRRFPRAGAWTFAILAAAGDVGASAAPWLTGRIVQANLDSPLAAWMARITDGTPEQGALRLGILVGVIFPLAALTSHLVLRKLAKAEGI